MIFFYPETIETKKSEINGEIKITKLFGKYRLVVGGYTQSGGLIYSIWQKALKSTQKKSGFKNPNILILGFGGGTATQVINQIWKKSKITGIEIDPIIIELAKKYFQIDEISNLELIKTDAIQWIKKQSQNSDEKFDLILVDLYIGTKPPEELMNEKFLASIKKLLSKNGAALFNRLIVNKKKSEVNDFKKNLQNVFENVDRISTPANAIFSTTLG